MEKFNLDNYPGLKRKIEEKRQARKNLENKVEAIYIKELI